MYEQEIKSYCLQAQKYLACEKKQRDRFDRLIADSANEFLKESPGSTFEELRAVLGEPQEAAALYMESLPAGTARRYQQKKRLVRALLIVLAVLAFALLAAAIVSVWKAHGVILVNTKTTVIGPESGI